MHRSETLVLFLIQCCLRFPPLRPSSASTLSLSPSAPHHPTPHTTWDTDFFPSSSISKLFDIIVAKMCSQSARMSSMPSLSDNSSLSSQPHHCACDAAATLQSLHPRLHRGHSTRNVVVTWPTNDATKNGKATSYRDLSPRCRDMSVQPTRTPKPNLLRDTQHLIHTEHQERASVTHISQRDRDAPERWTCFLCISPVQNAAEMCLQRFASASSHNPSPVEKRDRHAVIQLTTELLGLV